MTHSASPAPEAQSAAAVLMVRPAGFAFNPQTAESNAFQSAPGQVARAAADAAEALREFDGLAGALRLAGVEVIVAHDTPTPPQAGCGVPQ